MLTAILATALLATSAPLSSALVDGVQLDVTSYHGTGCPADKPYAVEVEPGGTGRHVASIRFSEFVVQALTPQQPESVDCDLTLNITGDPGTQVAITQARVRGSYVLAPRAEGSARLTLSSGPGAAANATTPWAQTNTTASPRKGPITAEVTLKDTVWSGCGTPAAVQLGLHAEVRSDQTAVPTLITLTTGEAVATVDVERRPCPDRQLGRTSVRKGQ